MRLEGEEVPPPPKVLTPPPEVVVARRRILLGVQILAQYPELGIKPDQVEAFRNDALATFQDPSKWEAVVEVQSQAEALVRSFDFPAHPTEADVEKAVGVLSEFVYLVIWKVTRWPRAIARMAARAAKSYLMDPERRAVLPRLYGALKVRLLTG